MIFMPEKTLLNVNKWLEFLGILWDQFMSKSRGRVVFVYRTQELIFCALFHIYLYVGVVQLVKGL